MDIPRAVGAPARRALAGAGWTRLDQLTAVTERELRALHGMGPKAIGVLRVALRDRGLSLAGEQADT
ncbi:DNA-binding protein [Micromonospora sp. A200]|uniref:DNA-binding protein n=1 Tax=Micromonospora sp. A200 TaxID=2940568 RepID=UPI0024730F0B|nr:DNA-binding protein [Micromonospora sp. A200]